MPELSLLWALGFVAFVSFIDMQEVLSAHSLLVVSFALCGFVNLSSIAIQLGGLGVMAPDRRGDIARLGLKSVLAGTLSNFMSAAIAGFFFVL